MHSAHVIVECDHEDEDYCPAEFTIDTLHGDSLGDLDIRILHQAKQRGWETRFDVHGRFLYICPLHRTSGARQR